MAKEKYENALVTGKEAKLSSIFYDSQKLVFCRNHFYSSIPFKSMYPPFYSMSEFGKFIS